MYIELKEYVISKEKGSECHFLFVKYPEGYDCRDNDIMQLFEHVLFANNYDYTIRDYPIGLLPYKGDLVVIFLDKHIMRRIQEYKTELSAIFKEQESRKVIILLDKIPFKKIHYPYIKAWIKHRLLCMLFPWMKRKKIIKANFYAVIDLCHYIETITPCSFDTGFLDEKSL